MKTRYILYGALAALATAGCTDLNVDIKSVYTEYPTDSEIAVEAKISDAYYAFRAALGRRYDEGISCNSDEYTAISFGGDYLNARDMTNFSLHSVDASACKNQLNVYNDLQGGITKCNQVLMDLGEENTTVSAPVRAARAFYTFMLMDNWGDTPIIDYRLLDASGVVERSPRADVARWIESELLEVRDDCPTDVSAKTYGTPTRWMVDALLAKLYINWNVYTQDVTAAGWSATAPNEKLADCIAACDDVIASGLFDLSDDYKTKFMHNNGPHIKDFIYVMPYDAVTNDDDHGLYYARFRTWRQGQRNNGFYSIPLSSSVGGNMALTPEFSALFCLPGDRRNDVIAGDGTQETFDVYQYDAVTGEKTTVRNLYSNETPVTFTRQITLVGVPDGDLNTGKDLTGWTQGYKSIKFFPYVEEVNSHNRHQSNDVPIFRYADILLMKCEALVRGASATRGDTPMGLFNQIRRYVNAPEIASAPTLQDILDERGREFLDEHWRRNDLIRFGDFERDWGFKHLNPNAKAPTNRLLPLSIDVLNLNTNWTQNPGY
jgi:hypothetical protein